MERLPVFALAERTAGMTLVPMAGVPVLPMAEHVVAAVRTAAGRAFPRSTRGRADLRAALAAHLGSRYGLAVDPERELLVTHGAQHGMSVALRALLASGDEVVVPAPTYFFDGPIRMAGARPVYVSTHARDGWRTDPDAVRAAITSATRALLLCNPNNPTGHTPDRDELTALLRIAAEYGLIVFSDESYARYVHSGPGYLPIQSLRAEHPDLVTVTSLSKNYAFSHWRVGYVHARAGLLDPIHRAFEWEAINVGDIPQIAAHAVVTGPQGWLDTVYSAFPAHRDLLYDAVRAAGLAAVRPEAGIFLFVDLGPVRRRGRELEDLLARYGITGVAGDAFRGPADHARLLYGGAPGDLVEVGRRLSALVRDTRGSGQGDRHVGDGLAGGERADDLAAGR